MVAVATGVMAGAAAVGAIGGLMGSSKASKASDRATAAQLAYQQQDLALRKWAMEREAALYDPIANVIKGDLTKEAEARRIEEETAFAGSLVDDAYNQKIREMEDSVQQSMPGSGVQAGLLTGMRVMAAKDKALAQYQAGKAVKDSIMGQRLAFIGRYSPTQNAAMTGQGLQAIASTFGQQSALYTNLAVQGMNSVGSTLSNYAMYLKLAGE